MYCPCRKDGPILRAVSERRGRISEADLSEGCGEGVLQVREEVRVVSATRLVRLFVWQRLYVSYPLRHNEHWEIQCAPPTPVHSDRTTKRISLETLTKSGRMLWIRAQKARPSDQSELKFDTDNEGYAVKLEMIVLESYDLQSWYFLK